MKALTVEKAQEIRAGKGHYHWICRDWANFTSKAYSSYAAAGEAADAHVAKYRKRLIFRYDRKIPDYFSVAGAP